MVENIRQKKATDADPLLQTQKFKSQMTTTHLHEITYPAAYIGGSRQQQDHFKLCTMFHKSASATSPPAAAAKHSLPNSIAMNGQ